MRFRTQVSLAITVLIVSTSVALGVVLVLMSTRMLYRQVESTGGAFTRMLAVQLEQKRALLDRMASGPPQSPQGQPDRLPGTPSPGGQDPGSVSGGPPLGPPPPAPEAGSDGRPSASGGAPPRRRPLASDSGFESDLLQLAEIAHASSISFVHNGKKLVTFAPRSGKRNDISNAQTLKMWSSLSKKDYGELASAETLASVVIMTKLNEDESSGPRNMALLVEFPKTVVVQVIADSFHWLVLTTLIIIAVAVATAWRVSHSISWPLSRLALTAQAYGKGDLDKPAPVHGPAETRNLGEVLNSMAASLKEHLRILKEEISRREQLESELRVAAELQRSLLPRAGLEQFDRAQVYGWSEAAKAVGGDFYDYRLLSDGRLFFVIGDATGKGIPAALLAGKCLSVLQALSEGCTEPGELLCRVNRVVAGQFKEDGHFVTLFLGIYDPQRSELLYSRAGHNPPLLARANDETPHALADQLGFPLAIRSCALFETTTLYIQRGDTLLLYTDGLTETTNQAKHLYGEERLIQMFGPRRTLSLTELMDDLTADVKDHGGVWPPEDDCTILLLRFA